MPSIRIQDPSESEDGRAPLLGWGLNREHMGRISVLGAGWGQRFRGILFILFLLSEHRRTQVPNLEIAYKHEDPVP